jgi:pantetheine-phosphate adenylyltransferase
VQVAVYPGSFDPLTNGHVDVIRRASRFVDRLVIAVLENPRKVSLLTAEERVAVIRRALADDPIGPAGIEVTTFDGLTVDLCRRVGATGIVRGLRGLTDFEVELSLAHNNAKLAPEVETLCLMTSLEVAYISSSLVKEIARFGGDVSGMVPPASLDAVRRAAASQRS